VISLLSRVGQNRMYTSYTSYMNVYTPYIYGFGQPYSYHFCFVSVFFSSFSIFFIFLVLTTALPSRFESDVSAFFHLVWAVVRT